VSAVERDFGKQKYSRGRIDARQVWEIAMHITEVVAVKTVFHRSK
jgi:hypothetical protein